MNLQLKQVIDSAKIIIICLSNNYKITEFNHEAEIFYEKQSQDVIGKDFLNCLIPEDYHESIQKLLNKILNRIESAIYEVPIKDINGKKVIIQWNFSRLIDDNDQMMGILALGYDITYFRMKERNLRESEENFKIFLQNFQGIAYQAYLDTFKLRLFMGKIEEITGYTSEDFLNQRIKWDQIIHPDDLPQVNEESKRMVLNHGYIADNEYRIFQKNGNCRWIRDISLKVFDTQSNETILQGSIFDITERKKFEDDLKNSESQYRKAYNRAEFYKDLFAHDINNILHNISMGIQLYSKKLKELHNVKNFEDINHILKEQVNRGAKLVSNIRKISQIEVQQNPLEPMELMRILKKSIEFIGRSFKHKSLSIQLETDLNEMIILANDFVQEIFDNILINAVKYTKEPDIFIKIKISKKQFNNRNFYKIQFIDNGIGIPDSMKKNIFLRSHDKIGNIGGMGLGLSLVRKIIDSYNGEISVEDKIKGDSSQGSNFIVLFPEIENINRKERIDI